MVFRRYTKRNTFHIIIKSKIMATSGVEDGDDGDLYSDSDSLHDYRLVVVYPEGVEAPVAGWW